MEQHKYSLISSGFTKCLISLVISIFLGLLRYWLYPSAGGEVQVCEFVRQEFFFFGIDSFH